MSSQDGSRDTDEKTPGKLNSQSPAESDEEPSDLVINIKEEPVDEEYHQDCQNGDTIDELGEDLHHHAEESVVESPSNPLNDAYVPHAAAKQEPQVTHTRVVLPPVVPASVPNGGGIRPFKAVRRDLAGLTQAPNLSSSRLVPIKIKTSGPIPIALTVSTPEVDPKTNSSTMNCQSSAHHLMTLATEADKILKKQEKRLNEKGSSSDHTDEGQHGTSDEDNVCLSDSNGGAVDPFLNSNDQTLTLIQRRAAEASLSASSSKKTKRKRSQLPDDLKDETYWERRRKNNEAAKRSRDARRAKEDQIAIRAALLEQENMRLRIEVAALKEETVKLRGMLYDKR